MNSGGQLECLDDLIILAAYSSLTLNMDTHFVVNMHEVNDDGSVNALVDWIFLSRSMITAIMTEDLINWKYTLIIQVL